MQPIVIQSSKSKLFLLMMGGLFMTLISVFIFKTGEIIIGAMVSLFFGGATVALFLKLLSNKPALIIDEKGITDNSAAINFGFIAWNDIAKVFLWDMAGTTSVCILPKDIESFKTKVHPLKRYLIDTNMNIMGAPFAIAANTLPMSAQELVQQLQNYVTTSTADVSKPSQTTPAIQFDDSVTVLKKWNWGAFVFGCIWGIAHNVWLSLLVFVPLVGTVMPVILGIKGNEWAWKAKKWQSIEEFERVQKKWEKAAFIFLGIALITISLIFLIAFFSNN